MDDHRPCTSSMVVVPDASRPDTLMVTMRGQDRTGVPQPQLIPPASSPPVFATISTRIPTDSSVLTLDHQASMSVVTSDLTSRADVTTTPNSHITGDIIDKLIHMTNTGRSHIPSSINNQTQGVVLHIPNINNCETTPSDHQIEIYRLDNHEDQGIKGFKTAVTGQHKGRSLSLPRTRRVKKKTLKSSRSFTCAFCSKISKRKDDLLTHLLTHTGEKPQQCPLCDKRFARKDYMNNHLRTHTGEKPFSCPVCWRAFSLKVNLNKHIRIHSEPTYKCTQCSKSFRRYNHLRAHSLTHSNNRCKPCPICNRLLKGDLRKHISRMHKNHQDSDIVNTEKTAEIETPSVSQNAIFSCSHCGTDFHSHLDLMQHIEHYLESVRNETGQNDTDIVMNHDNNDSVVIPADTPIRDDDEDAAVIVHDQNNVDRCGIVKSSKYTSASLDGLSNLCVSIGKPTSTSTSPAVPEKGIVETIEDSPDNVEAADIDTDALPHEIEVIVPPHVLDEVVKALQNQLPDADLDHQTNYRVEESQPDLVEHTVLNTNTDQVDTLPSEGHDIPDSTCTCTECGKQFAQKSRLTVHMRTHTGEKPYPCTQCGKAFTDKANYNKHSRIHSGAKPYVCPHCDAAFNRSSHLKNHLLKHDDQRSFTCTRCDADFKYRSTLSKHIKLVHSKDEDKTKIRQCDVDNCASSFTSLTALKQHKRLIHGGSSFCQVCGEKFASVCDLRKHGKQHMTRDDEDDRMKGLDDVLDTLEF